MISNKQARIIKDKIVTSDAVDEREFVSDDVASQVFAQEWLELNNRLSVEQSYQIQDEMDAVETVAEKLMIVRNWAGRLDTAESKSPLVLRLEKELAETIARCGHMRGISSKLPRGNRELYRLIRQSKIDKAQARLDAALGL